MYGEERTAHLAGHKMSKQRKEIVSERGESNAQVIFRKPVWWRERTQDLLSEAKLAGQRREGWRHSPALLTALQRGRPGRARGPTG